MKDKFILIIGYLIILIGLIKFDIFIYPTLDYFGKYVFVITLNIIPFWISWDLLKKGKLYSIFFSIIYGTILYLLS